MRSRTVPINSVLLAGAYGDALGKPFETYTGSTHSVPDPYEWEANGYSMLSGGPPSVGEEGFPAGRWTDDTQMTLTAARSLRNFPDATPEQYARIAFDSYYEWYEGRGPYGTARGVGGTIRAAMESPPYEPEIPADRSIRVGSGAAMRAAPFALRFPLDRAIDYALADTAITHPFVEAYAATTAFVSMISEKNPGKKRILRVLRDRGFRYTRIAGFLETIDGMSEVSDPEGDVADLLSEAIGTIRYYGGGLESVREAVKAGGDTDTRAALIAQIVVAGEGVLVVPEEDFLVIERRDEIVDLENALRALKGT